MDDIDNLHRLVDARINIVSVKPVKKHKHSRVFVYVGGFAVSLVLGMSILAPIFNSKSGLDLFNEWLHGSVKPVDNTSLAGEVVTPEPYIYVPPTRMGAFGKYVINVSYYRNWLNNTVSWKVEKSTDGVKWTDYKKFVVKKDWNAVDLTEKHTIVVTADEEAYYRVLTNTKTDKQLVDYTDDSKNTSFSMRFKVSESKDYTLLYNWSDYSKSAEASKTSMSKGVKTDVLSSKQYFEWMVVSSSKLKKDEVFTVDPVYGTIGNAVTDSWEFDGEEGRVADDNALVRLGTSEYYMTSAYGDTGTDSDGFLRILHVWNNNGTIETNIKSSWEYDTSDGANAGIIHISGDMYAVYYKDASAVGKIITTKAYSSNGTLRKTIDDTQNFALTTDFSIQMVHVTGDIYALIYMAGSAGGYDYQLETYEITSSGAITYVDALELNSDPTGLCHDGVDAIMLDSDTIAVVLHDITGVDAWLYTCNISVAGDISATVADSWEYSTSSSAYPNIFWVASNIYAVTWVNGSGAVNTISITTGGNIVGTTWIDSQSLYNPATAGKFYQSTSTFVVNDASTIPGGVGVYGIAGSAGSGNYYWIQTINISSDGTIANKFNDVLVIDPGVYFYQNPVVYVSGNYYLTVCTDGTSDDGWAYTVTIETYQAPAGGWTNVCPIAKGEHPTNNSANVALQVACGGTITDSNSNHTMNVTFATNRSGSWVNKQTNTSVANNSAVNWTYLQANSASTSYWWRMYVHDGFCNQSFTYKFTTAANASASWEVLDDAVNGVFTNTTAWHIRDSSINGVFTNTTVWTAADSSVNGVFTNTTVWKDVDTGINGEFTNTSYVPTWKVVDNTINGVFTNTTVWKVVDSGVNGLFTNTTKWRALDTGINGVFTNASVWHDVDSAINGVFTNTTAWYDLDTGVNGSFTNTSIPASWKIVDNTINGVFTNTTVWKDVDTGINGEFTNTSYVPTWKVVDNTINGVFTNTTVWKVLDSGVNGLFTNTTSWKALDTGINGVFTNASIWHDVDSAINGVFTNTTAWYDLDTGVNGSFTNTSIPASWKIVDNTVNGMFTNTTGWHIVNDTVNGLFTNTTVWKALDTGMNGIFLNTTLWRVIDNTFNGVFTNDTLTWQSVDSGVNGLFRNVSVWHIIDSDVNGSFTNSSSVWNILDNSINGRFINYTGNATGGVMIVNKKDLPMNTVFMVVGLVVGLIIPINLFRVRRKKKDEENF